MATRQAIVIAGAFGIDTNVYPVGGRRGAEVTFARTTDGPGQAGWYSAIASRALGVPTRAIAALGEDRLGAWVREELAARRVALTELTDPVGTHRSVNIMAGDGTRRNWFDARGASLVLVDAARCREALRGARILHCHLDDWCRAILPIAHEEGLLISVDLQDADSIDDPYRSDFVAAADTLFLSGANLPDEASAALELSARRPGRLVIVGAGSDGCLVVRDGRVERHAAIELPDPVVDTNGAGDTLAVGFLVAHLIDGLSVERAVRRGQIAARLVCAQRGDAKAPPTSTRIDRLESELAPSR